MNRVPSRRFSFLKAAIITVVTILGIGNGLANASSPSRTGISEQYNWMAGGGG